MTIRIKIRTRRAKNKRRAKRWLAAYWAAGTGQLVVAQQRARYANYGRDARITEAQIAGTPTLATPLSSIGINRNEITVNRVESFLDDQVDLTVKARIELSRETSDPTRFTWTGVPTGGSPSTSISRPTPTTWPTAFTTTSSIPRILFPDRAGPVLIGIKFKF